MGCEARRSSQEGRRPLSEYRNEEITHRKRGMLTFTNVLKANIGGANCEHVYCIRLQSGHLAKKKSNQFWFTNIGRGKSSFPIEKCNKCLISESLMFV